jgi:hypothetical protein
MKGEERCDVNLWKGGCYEACGNDKRDKLGKCSVCIATNAYPARIVYMHAYRHLVIDFCQTR